MCKNLEFHMTKYKRQKGINIRISQKLVIEQSRRNRGDGVVAVNLDTAATFNPILGSLRARPISSPPNSVTFLMKILRKITWSIMKLKEYFCKQGVNSWHTKFFPFMLHQIQ